MMNVMKALALILVSFIGLNAVAQQQIPRAEVLADYSLMFYNPDKDLANTKLANGGGGAFVYNLGKHIGMKGEFQGYLSNTFTYNVPTFPFQVLPLGSYKAQANLFTYLFGPEFKFHAWKGTGFFETLAGAAHTNGYANLYQAAGYAPGPATRNGFAVAAGGGFDYPLTKRVSLRVGEVDYLLTRFSVAALNSSTQSNFRYLGGIVIKLGQKTLQPKNRP